MTSFFDFLAQNTPNIQTRKALILTGLQNEFLAPDGRLLVKRQPEFIDSVKKLVEGFRPHGDLIWIRSEFDPDVNPALEEIDDYNTVIHLDDQDHHGSEPDEELFLNPTPNRPQLCLKSTTYAGFLPEIGCMIQPKDIQIVKNQYSAFSGTPLISTLRSRLITKVYICGAMSNISVHATALDAARYGVETILVEDCLAYRHVERHELAVKRLLAYSVARALTSERALHFLRNPEEDIVESDHEYDEESEDEEDEASEPEALLRADDNDSEDEMPLPTTMPLRFVPRPTRDHRRHDAAETSLKTGGVGDSAVRCTSGTFDAMASPTQPALEDRTGSKRKHESTTTQSPTSSRDNPTSRSCRAIATGPTQTSNTTMHASDDSQDQVTVSTTAPLFGEDNALESAGSTIVYDLLPLELATTAFEQIQAEVEWQRMLHQTGEVPRLVCCQASIGDDGSVPVYRHPSDKTIAPQSWTPGIDQVRRIAEKHVGHSLNHGLIQLYRDGNDFISEHSDKTLDIVPGSKIVNVSLGAERTMRLRSKRVANTETARTTHRVRMPHNSMISMTLETNATFLHGINADKRRRAELTAEELAFDGQRISMTFRQIGTFSDADGSKIWGQGAVGKTKADAGSALTGDAEESNKLIKAFGTENQSSTMAWSEWYGAGSNVLHLK